MQQVEMICLEDLVPESHNYRRFAKIWSFNLVEKRLKKLEKNNPSQGIWAPSVIQVFITAVYGKLQR